MINRVLIRIRVVQILFSYYHNETTDLKKAENELLFSLQKSYDLYFYFLTLLIEITDEYKKKVEARKSKLLPTLEDMNPNTKLLDNKFIQQLRENKQVDEYVSERPFDWSEHDALIRTLLEKILESEIYKEYLADSEGGYEADRDFWRKVFKQIICNIEDLYLILEDESIYWNDDIEIVESFTLKTIKKFEEANGADQELLPMFRDETDKEFATELLKQTILRNKEHGELIKKHTANWESERIASMDMLIMQIALAEIRTFASIPVNVSLNEYIDISKSYSTAKSAGFINGILDTIVKEMQEQNLIFKK